MTITKDSTVGTLAAEHPLATRVFARHGIDFCCAGGQDLGTACDTRGVDVGAFIAELEQEINGRDETNQRWDDKPLGALIDHILTTYHVPLKEEEILFPAIKAGQGDMAGAPMRVMEMEHEALGGMLRTVRELTDGFRVPDGACNTWRALWVGLEDLERSLHEHIHLENNILHPRARQQ